MKPDTIKKVTIRAVPAAILVALSAYLLKGDVWTFWTWYLLAMVLGIVTMPLTGRLFREFDDKGWMFSKVLAVVVTGFGTWFLVAVKLLKFTSLTCIGVTLACGAGCLLLGKVQHKKGIECLPVNHLDLVYWEEILFFDFFPSVDLSGRISSCGIRNRKIYGLWVYGSHDAKHHSSGS